MSDRQDEREPMPGEGDSATTRGRQTGPSESHRESDHARAGAASRPGSNVETPRARAAWLLLGLLPILVLLAIATWGSFLTVGLVGHDSYPTIVAARIQNASDFLGTFTEELMDGRFVSGGRFWRPLVNLSFAFDHFRGGLDPRAYHTTDFAILIGTALAIACCARRLFDQPARPARVAASVASILFLLHPVHLEVLPVAPRRAEPLYLLGLVACVALQPRPDAAASRARTIASFLAALWALSAKETGALVAPLVLGLHWLERGGRPFGARVLESLRAAAPLLVALALFGVAHTLALGGLGGHPDSNPAAILNAPRLVLPYLDWVLLPHLFPAPRGPLVALAVALVVGLGLSWFAGRASSRTSSLDDPAGSPVDREAGASAVHSRPRPELGPSPASLAWLVLFFALAIGLNAMAGERVKPWYALGPLVATCLAIGGLVQVAVRALRPLRIALAAPAAALAIVLGGAPLIATPLWYRYDAWSRADEAMRAFLTRFDRELDAARPGQVVVLDRLPFQMPAPKDAPGVRAGAMLDSYSLQAYAELTRPEQRVRVERYTGGPIPRATADGGVLVLVTVMPMRSGPRRGAGGR